MSWKLRLAINTCKALVPFHQQLREWKNSRAWNGDRSDARETIEQGLLQIEWLKTQFDLREASTLEVGTGWEPRIPMLLSLAGARRVYTCDLNRLCAVSTLKATLESVRKNKDLITGRLGLSGPDFDRALGVDAGAGVEKALDQMRITYLAPCDCRHVPLPDASLDVVTSRAVLEHIPPDVIHGIYVDAFRLLRPGGVMCHIIDNSDHWQHVDRSLSRVNFLKYPDWLFRWTHINGLDYQNRLRHSEHVALMTGTGFEIVREERDVDEGSLKDLGTLRLDQRFSRFTPEDLAVLTSTLLVRKP
jgi:SAM-dependent methyltransferase